jgi:hypothetical protein
MVINLDNARSLPPKIEVSSSPQLFFPASFAITARSFTPHMKFRLPSGPGYTGAARAVNGRTASMSIDVRLDAIASRWLL